MIIIFVEENKYIIGLIIEEFKVNKITVCGVVPLFLKKGPVFYEKVEELFDFRDYEKPSKIVIGKHRWVEKSDIVKIVGELPESFKRKILIRIQKD